MKCYRVVSSAAWQQGWINVKDHHYVNLGSPRPGMAHLIERPHVDHKSVAKSKWYMGAASTDKLI